MSIERVLRSGPGSLFVVVLDQDVYSIEIEMCVKRHMGNSERALGLFVVALKFALRRSTKSCD
jgi:hypothetical protein